MAEKLIGFYDIHKDDYGVIRQALSELKRHIAGAS